MSTNDKADQIQVLDNNIAAAIKTLARSLGGAVRTGRQTCVHCLYFDMLTERCYFYTPAVRPPAQVIAFGCEAFAPDDIPF
jgi:hypothetical protein